MPRPTGPVTPAGSPVPGTAPPAGEEGRSGRTLAEIRQFFITGGDFGQQLQGWQYLLGLIALPFLISRVLPIGVGFVLLFFGCFVIRISAQLRQRRNKSWTSTSSLQHPRRLAQQQSNFRCAGGRVGRDPVNLSVAEAFTDALPKSKRMAFFGLPDFAATMNYCGFQEHFKGVIQQYQHRSSSAILCRTVENFHGENQRIDGFGEQQFSFSPHHLHFPAAGRAVRSRKYSRYVNSSCAPLAGGGPDLSLVAGVDGRARRG